MVSRIDDGAWVARKCFVENDDEMALEIVRAGSENPSQLTSQLLETEMVRRRRPMRVDNPQSNPRMHERLKIITQTRNYVAAPIISGDSVIGFLHADEPVDSYHVDEFCRDMIGMFAEGIGYAIERLIFYHRLQSLRCTLNEYTNDVNSVIDEFVTADIQMASTDLGSRGSSPSSHTSAQSSSRSADHDISTLTRREADVLRLMAVGETNAKIANRLVISEGTVKSHAKHILRKLGVANRAEAVSHYHTLTQRS